MLNFTKEFVVFDESSKNKVDGIFIQECGIKCTDYANNAKFWQPSWIFKTLWKSKLILTNLFRFPILQNIYLEIYNINLWQLEAEFWKCLFWAFTTFAAADISEMSPGRPCIPNFQC